MSLYKNLYFPESGLSFALNIFLNKSNVVNLLNPINYGDSCNIELLRSVDESSTVGKISFLPLAFLREYFINNNYNIEVFDNELLEKEYYIYYLKEKDVFSKNFFEINKFKNIPIKYFRKSFLSSSLTQTVDYCKIESNECVIDIPKIKTVNLNSIITRNENEWLSKQDLSNIIIPKLLSLTKELQELVLFIPLIFLKNPIFNHNFTCSDILNSFNWNSIPDRRFIIFFILYKSHFTSVIIDQETLIKDKKKNSLFF